MDSAKSSDDVSNGMQLAAEDGNVKQTTTLSPKEDDQSILISSKVKLLETRYIELLEKRIEALESVIREGKDDNDQDENKKQKTDDTKSDGAKNEDGNSEVAKDTDSEKQTDQQATEEAEKKDQKQSRILYRESRYNSEGIREEKDIEEDKGSNQTSSTDGKVERETSAPHMVQLKKYDENGKYKESELEVKDLNLNALILFVLAHDPRYKHYNPSVKSTFYSPYEAFIHSWTDFQDLVSMDKEKPIWVELSRKFERPQESHNRQKDLENPGSIHALKNPEVMSSAIEDLKLLLAKIEASVELEEYFKTARERPHSTSSVSWELLWTIFPPGELVLARSCFKQPQLFIVYYADPTDIEEADEKRKELWLLFCWTYDWDGTQFNRGFVVFEFERFKDEKQISTLPCYPLKYDRDPHGVELQLIERGRKFCNICLSSSSHVHEYSGAALARGEGFRKVTRSSLRSDFGSLLDSSPHLYGSKEESKGARRSNLSRDQVIVDHKAYVDHGPPFRVSPHMGDLELIEPEGSARCQCQSCEENHRLSDNQKTYFDGKREKDIDSFEELHYKLLPPRVLGYWLTQKRWLELNVDQINTLADNMNADSFGRLQMDEAQKDLIRNLIRNHAGGDGAVPIMQDLSKEKGTGLIILLHGPPGVGKTSTAESISKATGKPLLPVAVSDIGLDPADIQRKLDVLFDLAASWKAVLLFDEADVFLESRANNTAELGRNALVSVLLRSLEYYSGILILTTNRITSLDIAVQSRINLAIRYPELDDQQKRRIYENFVHQLKYDNANKAELLNWINEREKERDPPFRNLNGRQIRNILFSAASLAGGRDGGGKLGISHVKQILRETKLFQEDVQRHTDNARRMAEVGVSIS